ncbi:unnamed protein product [Orchesella dallaii]|uniref:Ig-like domain-containing protein n=1 Tax=Orchesella dallaii TaxID=48710 RepID=A0ABP1S9U0_9HEXA
MKKGVLSSSFFLLLPLFDNLLISVRASETKPQIIFGNVGAAWANITTGSNNVFYSPTGSDLFVSCKAPYPIQWNISGLIAPADIVKIQPPRRNLHENIFEIKTNYFFVDAHNYHGIAASAQVACEKISDHAVRDHFTVFVRGNNPFVEPATKVVTDSKLIPCPTTDPTSPTTLYLKAPNGVDESVVQNAIYNPTEGFHSDNVFNGVYECRKQSSSITITANITGQADPNSDHQFSPSHDQIRVFTDESIELTCSSKSKSIVLVADENSNVSLQYSVDTDKIKTARLSVLENSRKVNIKGKVICVTGENKEVIKEWSYEFIEAPELYLDNFEGEVDCLSTQSPKMVQTVRCRNSMDCQFMDHCFRNASFCNFKKQKQFYATTDTFCWIEKIKSGRACASVPYSHLNGRVQCSVSSLTRKYEFFVALDFLRYSNWKDAPEKELLRLDTVPEVLYTNESTQFFCTGSAYLFADSLSFEIEFKNGTKHLLQDDGEMVNISNPYSENPRKIDEFNVLGVLNINLPIDAVAIHCLAPWWNSTDIMVTSSRFETIQLIAPVMSEESETGTKKIVYKNEPDQRLTCFAEGKPQPSYQWVFRNDTSSEFSKVEDVCPSLTTSIGSTGKGYLEFVNVTEMNSGEYKCVATNNLGSVSRNYQVQVSNEKKPCVEKV